MDAATLYMIAVCAGTLCLPLEQYGFAMTKPECETKLMEVARLRSHAAHCLTEADRLALLKRDTTTAPPSIGPIAH